MKRVLFALLAMPILSIAQETSKTMSFDGEERKYIEYVPSSYNGSTSVPLVISLHGLGDNMNNFKNVGFQQLSESENFIVITPEALVDDLLNATAWNSGAGAFGFTLNADVDDIGFIGALIDATSTLYNIDQSKIYATGFSMGGFMSNRLACEFNWRIAAIASVAGTIGSGITCEPGREVPMAHFHGTEDGTVRYTDNQYGNDAEDLVAFWTQNNGCNNSIDSVTFPSGTQEDSIVVKRYVYTDCANGTKVTFYKAIGADHQWLYTPVNDISYTEHIWDFLNAQSHPNPTGVGLLESKINPFEIDLFPNPSTDNVRIRLEVDKEFTFSIYDNKGVLLMSDWAVQSAEISIADLATGVYHVKVETELGIAVKRFVKE